MLKKMLIVVGVVAVGSWMFTKTDLGSYASTAWKDLRGCVKKQVPVDFEIKRAKDMIVSLDKESDKLISMLAKEMVAIEKLDDQVKSGQAYLEKESQAIKTASADLKSGRTVFVSTIGNTSREQFSLETERRFNRYRLREATLENHKVDLGNHRETLAAAKEQLEAMRTQKADLQARIDKLETDLQIVKAAEARSKYVSPLDDSRLAKVKELVDEIEKAIQERKYEVQIRDDHRPSAVTPVRTSNPNLTEIIDSHFGNGSKPETTVTAEK